MTEPLLTRVLMPVANDADAESTCGAVLPRVAAAEGRVTAVVVVEKAGGAPDKASVEQRELAARDALDVVESRASDAGVPVETDIVYGTDVTDAILDAAADADATAIAFTPREGGGLLVDLLSGDVARKLVNRSDRPVVVLPAHDRSAEETDTDEPGHDGGDAAG